MSATAAASREAGGRPAEAAPAARWWRTVVRSLAPVILALVAGGLLLLALGQNPVRFYVAVWQGGVESGGWQDSAVLMAPLLLIALGLIVVFRAGIWNLGYDGQYLLGAALVAGFGPGLLARWPAPLAYAVLFAVAGGAGALWALVPAVLKAWYETNEIITTLMMSFIGIGVANILVKGPFQDHAVNIPQTPAIPFGKLLPNLSGTRVHVGVLLALAAVVVVHYLLTRTSFGLRLSVLGANPRTAGHVGINVRRVIVTSFLWSGFLIGVAAAVDVLGLWAYVRANWNPGYGNAVIPFVFLARLNPLAVVPFVAFYAVLSTGGDLAAQQANLPTDFLLVLVALILLFMTVIEFLGRRRDLGRSYLTPGLKEALRRPLFRRPAGPMNGLLTQSFLTALVAGGIVAAVPLMFTALGESVSERAGVLNIGLEGMLLLGAYLGFLGAYELHSEWLGFVAGVAGGLAGAIVMALLSVGMGLDQIVVGIAITLAGEGITSVLQQAQFKGKFPGLGNPATVAIPGLSRIPVLGHSVFDQPLLVYLGVGLLALVAWVFRATSWGLNLRAAGEKPAALDAAGISVLAVRTYAVLTTGALAGLGGAYLAIVGASTFTPFMTQGQGYIAIVIAMLARGKPLWVGVSSFVFGICLSIGTALQLASISISSDFIDMLPYIAIMAALVLFARGSYLPPALCLPYVRGGK